MVLTGSNGREIDSLYLICSESDCPGVLKFITPPRSATTESYLHLVLPNVEPYRRRGWSRCWFEFVELMPVGSGDLFDSLVSERPQDQRMQSAGSQSVGVSDSETLCRQGTNGLHLYSVAMRLRHQGIASGLVEFTTQEYCPDSSNNSVWSVSSQLRTILQLHYDCALKAGP